VFCPLILISKPHKRHLPSFSDTSGLMGVRGDELSPNLRDCGVLGIALSYIAKNSPQTPAPSAEISRANRFSVVSHVTKTSLVVKET